MPGLSMRWVYARQGLSNLRYLSNPYFHAQQQTAAETGSKLDEKWLIKEMENDLKSLRGILGMTVGDMAEIIGLSENDYLALEAGEKAMDWDYFMSFLFIFRYNRKTEAVVEALGLCPTALKERLIWKNTGSLTEKT